MIAEDRWNDKARNWIGQQVSFSTLKDAARNLYQIYNEQLLYYPVDNVIWLTGVHRLLDFS